MVMDEMRDAVEPRHLAVTRRGGGEYPAAASRRPPPTAQACGTREQARPSLQAKRDQTGKVRKGGACLVLAWCSRGFQHDPRSTTVVGCSGVA